MKSRALNLGFVLLFRFRKNLMIKLNISGIFLFVLPTLEDFSSSEKNENCSSSEVYEFLLLNEFEEMAANYIVINALHSCFSYKILIQAEMEEILKTKKYPPFFYHRIKAFGLLLM